jgi:hypothetical protein
MRSLALTLMQVSRYTGLLAQVHTLNNFLRTHFPTDPISPASLHFVAVLRTILHRSCSLDRCQQLLYVLDKSLGNAPAES